MAAKKTANKVAKKTPVSSSEKSEAADKPAAKKAAKAAKKVSPKQTTPDQDEVAAPKKSAKPSLDAIARAAYLNYRRRVEQSLPGDSHGDWLEAERQASESA